MIERTFQTLDRLEVPDLGRDVDRRRKSEGELRPIPEPRGTGRRVTTVLVALAVFAAAAGFGLRAWTRHHEAKPVADPWSWAGQGWTRIADPPERSAGASWVWAGGHLIEWGGCTGDSDCSATNQGFSYDPGTRSWTQIPPAPRPGHDPVAVAQGDRAYFFEGQNGQAFDATTNVWTELPEAPIELDHAVWAGSRIIVLQDATASGRTSAAAAFDPATNGWQVLAPPPIDFNVATVTWTGDVVIVLSGLLNGRNVPASPTVNAMSFDPAFGAWRRLPETALYPGSFASSYLNGRLIAWDYGMRWQALDPAGDVWSEAEKMPLDESECYTGGSTVGAVVFAWYCGDAAILEGGGWKTVHGGPLDEQIFSPAYEREIDVWRFADLVPAGDVLLLPMTGITLAPSGEACYGCPGSPESIWVYRPPSGASDSTPSLSTSLWPGVGPGLTALPAPPRVLASSTQVWTGRELLVWGGNEEFGDPPHFNEGYVFDASTLEWRELPPSPLEGRSWATGVWDGQEVLIWGGAVGYSSDDTLRWDGASYDPGKRSWRLLPEAPISTPVLGSVWTGEEMIVIGSSASAAFTPSTDTWRLLSNPPADFEDASVVWTGHEVIVFGDEGGRTAGGAIYNPETDAWRDLPAPDLPVDGAFPNGIDANASDAVWDGFRLVVTDYLLRAAAFNPSTGAWSSLPRLPVNACEGYPTGVPVVGGVVVQFCGEQVMISPGDDRWHVVSGRGELGIDWTTEVVSAEDTVLLLPNPSGSERYRTYAYRPPTRESSERRAWDIAAAFGALRSHFPFEPGTVPPTIEKEIGSLLSAEARAAWEDPASGLGRFWAYYPGFEVRSVEQTSAGSFEARVRFTKYSGSDTYDELLTIAPGTGLDGRPHDLVIVGAKPG